MASEQEKKDQFFKAQEEIKKLFEAITSAPLAEIKSKIDSLISASQKEEEHLTLSSIVRDHKVKIVDFLSLIDFRKEMGVICYILLLPEATSKFSNICLAMQMKNF